MIVSVLFMLLFAISGVFISEVVFAKHSFLNRIWLGLTIGLLMLTWLPSLFALLFGFTIVAQILSAVISVILLIVSVWLVLIRRKQTIRRSYSVKNKWICLLLAFPLIALFFYLLYTHILFRHQNGSVWVGQVTYGDLAMHLGFMTSIAEQGIFPPQYSIFPGHALNYPFLCETSGASLYQLGASVRQAYILSAGYAFVLVTLGVYLFFAQWLKRPSRAALATILFFLGGGFGFFYFFDMSKSDGILSSLLQTNGQTVSQTLLEGFYQTPTNIPALGLRWVNPIVDMLLPQRATLFGWAFLFPCLYLLHGFAFENKSENVIPLGVIAGLLPLIHTHSFLALGILSAVYLVIDLISTRFASKRILKWLVYALIACILAAPQLLLFTFKQASESSLVRFHLNWANEGDSYLWFYIKNLGLIFLLMPIALLILPNRDKKIYSGALILWLIAETLAFQPNNYDNNKLLFVWYAFTCGLVSKFLLVLKNRISHFVRRKIPAANRTRGFHACIIFLLTAFTCYYLFKLCFEKSDSNLMRSGTAFTLFVSAGLLLFLCVGAVRESKKLVCSIVPFVFSLWQIGSFILLWLKQYASSSYAFSVFYLLFSLILCVCGLLVYLLNTILKPQKTSGKVGFSGALASVTVASYLLLFAMTASSVMTIVRECKSEYQVYTKSEYELSEQIQTLTEPDAVILANNYHWNLVTPLTGRSIVTGTASYLYYHGIDTSERERDVALMFEEPQDHAELFEKYGVTYVLISNAERWNYSIDYSYLSSHAEIVAQNDAGKLYRILP